jgi:chemotaxis protein methyltransferase CheR
MKNVLLLSTRFRHVTVPSFVRGGRRPVRIDVANDDPESAPLSTDADDDELAFCRWVLNRAGLKADAYRSETLKRRVAACLRALRVRQIRDARSLLERTPSQIHVAASALLVGVTSFFRDQPVFELLEREVARLSTERQGLQVWSAGCSDGQELYSVAMLLDAVARLEGSYLIGTDCRPEAIAHAKLGMYSMRDVAGLPRQILARYFVRSKEGFQLREEAKRPVRYRVADLLSECEPGVWDLILCRNTTMYMHASATARLWGSFEGLLRPGGLLVLGKAERPVGMKRLALVGSSVYRRVRS